MAKYYYLDELNVGHGPVDAATISQLLQTGDRLVWRAGLADWVKAGTLAEFRNLAAPRPQASLAEMLQLCRAIIADAVVETHEAQQLKAWIAVHPEVTGHWPGNILAQRISDIYRDGIVTPSERTELHDLLQQLLQQPPSPADVTAMLKAQHIDQPAPTIGFPQKAFCFAGRLVYGPLERCHAALHQRQSQTHIEPQWGTHYLVVGGLRPDEKLIQQAVKLRKLGSACKIVTEEHWVTELSR